MTMKGTIPEAVPVEHVEAVMRCARRVRRHYIGGTAWRKCLHGAMDVVAEVEGDADAQALGILAEFAAGEFADMSMHCWGHLTHPDWPEPLVLDVTIDQFDMTGTHFRYRRPRVYPRIFLGIYDDDLYWRITSTP